MSGGREERQRETEDYLSEMKIKEIFQVSFPITITNAAITKIHLGFTTSRDDGTTQ